MPNIQTITTFLTDTIWGILLLGISGSILATLILIYRKKISAKVRKEIMFLSFKEGYVSSYADNNSFRQSILTTRPVIKMVADTFYLIIASTIFTAAIQFIPVHKIWIPISIYILIVTSLALHLQHVIRNFNFLFKLKFDEESKVFDKEVEYRKSWANIIRDLKPESNLHENTEKIIKTVSFNLKEVSTEEVETEIRNILILNREISLKETITKLIKKFREKCVGMTMLPKDLPPFSF